MTDLLAAIEIGDASSVAVRRIAKLSGYRSIALSVVESYPALEVAGKVIDVAEQTSATVELAGVEQVDRVVAALLEGRAWLVAALREGPACVAVSAEGRP